MGEKTYILFERNRNSLEIKRRSWFSYYDQYRIKITSIGNAFLMNRGFTYEILIPTIDDCIYKLGGALGERESAWLLQEILTWLDFK